MNLAMPVTLLVAVTILHATLLADEPRRGAPLPKAAEVISLQSPSPDAALAWPDSVASLGRKVEVVLVSAERIVSTPLRITPYELLIETDGRGRAVLRAEICQMTAHYPVHREAWMVGLGAVGAYLGFAPIAGNAENGQQSLIAASTAGGAAAGALVGYLIAKSHEVPAVLVFRSPEPKCAFAGPF